MNLVYVTPFLRVPPDFGLGIRNYHILKHLTERNSVSVVTYGRDETGQTDRWLTERGCAITRLPFSFPWRSSYTRWSSLRRVFSFPGGTFQRYSPETLGKCLLKLISAAPDIEGVILDTQLTGQVVLRYSIPRPCILALADIQQMLLRRTLSTIGWRPLKLIYAAEWLKTREYEQRIINHHRHIVVVSPQDKQFVADRCPHADVALIPNGVDTEYFSPADGQTGDHTLLFVGGFEYGPNVDAFHYFYREILPLVRTRIADVRFIAAGRNPPASLRVISERDPNVIVTGTVDDMRPYYGQSALVVVPMRYGGGTKLKVLEAFAMGVPVVSTSVGCEGISASSGEHLVIADTPAEFARKVCELLGDRRIRDALAHRARDLVQARFEWSKIAAGFEDYLGQVVGSSSTATTAELEAQLS